MPGTHLAREGEAAVKVEAVEEHVQEVRQFVLGPLLEALGVGGVLVEKAEALHEVVLVDRERRACRGVASCALEWGCTLAGMTRVR